MDFIEELNWRGLIHDLMPGTKEQLSKEMTTGYIGFDPTSDSLHIGHLVSVMILKHFQLSGHKPIVLVGGATGMIGDPSGKSEERNLLDEELLRHNEKQMQQQLEKFLDYGKIKNKATTVNNYDWMKEVNFLDFIRDIGKHISVNYMMAKDSVKKRLEVGISFTEFTYQLVQAYDYLYLYTNLGCKIQMGGSDQWGNITTGTELIRRKSGGEAFALTSPLITKADGNKFGKTEEGNVWLDPKKTSPYKFYQFWLNVSDADSESFIKIFTQLNREVIDKLIIQNKEAPHLRILQKELAKQLTILVHSEDDYLKAVRTSEILFGKGSAEEIKNIDTSTLLTALEGIPKYTISKSAIDEGIPIVDLLAIHSQIFPSKSEARRVIKDGGLSINKTKITSFDTVIQADMLIQNTFLFIQSGKKNYYLIICK